jgi:hypothetical protein
MPGYTGRKQFLEGKFRCPLVSVYLNKVRRRQIVFTAT